MDELSSRGEVGGHSFSRKGRTVAVNQKGLRPSFPSGSGISPVRIREYTVVCPIPKRAIKLATRSLPGPLISMTGAAGRVCPRDFGGKGATAVPDLVAVLN